MSADSGQLPNKYKTEGCSCVLVSSKGTERWRGLSQWPAHDADCGMLHAFSDHPCRQ